MHTLYKKTSLLLALPLFTFFGCDGLKKQKVDLIVHNATIYQVDDAFGTAEAMAIVNDTIVEIGPEHEIMNQYQAKDVLNARQQFVYPGFIDGHCHFYAYGMSLEQVDLRGTTSWEECLKQVEQFSKNNQYEWIQGRGWDQNDWEQKEFPTNKKLNELFPDTPVLLRRIDGHAAIANNKALALANITTSTTVDGGVVEVKNNQLTGILVDNAVDLIMDIIPDWSDDAIRNGLKKAEENCFAVGLTTVDDAGLSKSIIDIIQQMQQDSALRMRIYAMLTDNEENFEYFLKSGPIKTSHLNVRSFKFYGDGALGSRGAALIHPYHDKPEETGFLLSHPDYFRNKAQQVFDAGFQMNTHCIGDSAARVILSIYGEMLKDVNDRRWRIEHAQVIHPEDIDLFRKYTIIPSIQPTHATSDMYWAEDRLGHPRITSAYAYQDLLKQNSIVALGTDFPIEGIAPLETFYSAVFRQDHNDFPKGGFQKENALTREQTIRGMTIWNAIANFEEEEKGSLVAGKLADFVLLNLDLMKVQKEQFDQLNVQATYVGGKKVYSKK